MVAIERRETKVRRSRTECMCANQIPSGMVRQEAAWIKYDVQLGIQQEQKERSKDNVDGGDIV